MREECGKVGEEWEEWGRPERARERMGWATGREA